MPDFEDKIPLSEFSVTGTLHDTDRVPVIQADGQDWDNFCVAMLDLALRIVKDTEYISAGLNTSSKKIIGAINEVLAQAAKVDIASKINTPAPIMTFSDGGDDIPLKSLVTEIVPIQSGSGVPSPQNVRAISGHSSITVNNVGKYHRIIPTSLAPQTNNGITVTPRSDGTFEVSGTATANSTVNFAFDSYVIYSDDGKKVAFNNSFADSTINISFRNGTTQVDGWSVSPTNKVSGYSGMAGKTIDNFNFYVPSGKTVNGSFRIEFYIDSTVQTPVTINLGQTVYGGSLECVEGSGTKTLDIVDLGDLSYTMSQSGQLRATYNLVKRYTTGETKALCSHYEVWTGNQSTDFNALNNVVTVGNASIATADICIRDSAITSAQDAPTALAGRKLIFELATPTSLSVSGANIPTLSGVNNINTDCGDIQSLEYFNNKANDIATLIRLMTE